MNMRCTAWLSKERRRTGALIGANLRSLAANASKMNMLELDALASGVIELTAKALVPALDAAGRSTDAQRLASLVTIRRFIDRNLQSNEISPEMLARKFGLSRASLYRLFEPLGGVADYIRERRLLQAYQEVVSVEFSNRRIGQIGFRLGFGNVSGFSRAFRLRFGMSPSEARKAVATKSAPVANTAPDNMGESLGPQLARIGRRR